MNIDIFILTLKYKFSRDKKGVKLAMWSYLW